MGTKGLAAWIAALLFAWSSPSHAATVDITVELVPGTTQWTLSLQSNGPLVGGIMLEISNSLGGFTSTLPFPPVICALACEGLGSATQPFSLTLPTPSGPPPFLPLPNGVLGYFSATTSSPSEILVLPGDTMFGTTAIDTNGSPVLDYAIHVVPEPAAGALLAAAAILAGAVRRRIRAE